MNPLSVDVPPYPDVITEQSGTPIVRIFKNIIPQTPIKTAAQIIKATLPDEKTQEQIQSLISLIIPVPIYAKPPQPQVHQEPEQPREVYWPRVQNPGRRAPYPVWSRESFDLRVARESHSPVARESYSPAVVVEESYGDVVNNADAVLTKTNDGIKANSSFKDDGIIILFSSFFLIITLLGIYKTWSDVLEIANYAGEIIQTDTALKHFELLTKEIVEINNPTILDTSVPSILDTSVPSILDKAHDELGQITDFLKNIDYTIPFISLLYIVMGYKMLPFLSTLRPGDESRARRKEIEKEAVQNRDIMFYILFIIYGLTDFITYMSISTKYLIYFICIGIKEIIKKIENAPKFVKKVYKEDTRKVYQQSSRVIKNIISKIKKDYSQSCNLGKVNGSCSTNSVTGIDVYEVNFGKGKSTKSNSTKSNSTKSKTTKKYSDKVIKLAKKYRIKLDKNVVKKIKELLSLQKKAKQLKVRITKTNSKGQRVYKTYKELLRELKAKKTSSKKTSSKKTTAKKQQQKKTTKTNNKRY